MIFIKAYTRLNLGDDLLIKRVCDYYKDEKFCILTSKEYKDVFKSVKNLEVMSEEYEYLQSLKKDYDNYLDAYMKIINKIANKCDTFFYVGGSIFIEGGPTSVTRVRQLKNEIKAFKKAYIMGANFGPCLTKEYFNCVHDEIIPLLDCISFRDKDSYNLFKDLNNVVYAPDIVFSLETSKNIEKKKEIGISLINQIKIDDKYKNAYDDYLDSIITVTKRYINDGFKVRFLSFCKYEKDELAIDDIMSKISEDDKKHVVIDNYCGNLEEYLNIFSSLDTVIATRFHAIVLALKYSCNVIPICYSNKSVNLLNDIGIKDYVDFSNIKNLVNTRPSKVDIHTIKLLEIDAIKHFSYKKDISN